MIIMKCPECGREFYVNPSVLRQKKTRCPYCHKFHYVEDYARTDRHGLGMMTKEQRQSYTKTVAEFVTYINEKVIKNESK